MIRSKHKGGKGFNRSGIFGEGGESRADRAQKRNSASAARPRREMRERIEARDEERSLTRELSDWDSYNDDR